MFMVFCSNCGEKLSDEANFCTKCGIRTKHGVEVGVSVPTEDLREAFSKMGVELEKAFQTAAKEIQKAVKNVREDVRDSRSRQPVACKSCGEKSPAGAVYCTKCGEKLE
jgi:predicted amidophosphoribosyltransferase